MPLNNLILNSMYTIPAHEWDAFKHDANFLDHVKSRMARNIGEYALHADLMPVKIEDSFNHQFILHSDPRMERPDREVRMQAAVLPVDAFKEIVDLARDPKYYELATILNKIEQGINKVQSPK